jgi:hypothetical protein
MSKNQWLKWINGLLLILVIWVAGTGIFNKIIPDELYEKIHPTGGILLLLSVIVHLGLNWNWVKATYLKKHTK